MKIGYSSTFEVSESVSVYYQSTEQLKYSNCTVKPSKCLEKISQAHSMYYFGQDHIH